jgi:hypothetical protein
MFSILLWNVVSGCYGMSVYLLKNLIVAHLLAHAQTCFFNYILYLLKYQSIS